MAPEQSHAKYVGKYDAGYDVLLERRLERMRALGLVAEDAPIPPRQAGEVAWEELSEEQQKREARMMETIRCHARRRRPARRPRHRTSEINR